MFHFFAFSLFRSWRQFIRISLFLKRLYWGWGILNLATLGVTGILYSNPYKIAALSEYYVGLRKKAIEEKTEGCEYLNADTIGIKKLPDLILFTIPANTPRLRPKSSFFSLPSSIIQKMHLQKTLS